MSGVDLEAITKGLATLLADGIADVNGYWYPVLNPQYPNAMVIPSQEFVTYRETFGAAGRAQINLELRVQVTGIDPESATRTMYRLLSAGAADSSLFDVAETDATWGGTVESGILFAASGPSWVTTDSGADVMEARLSARAVGKKA